MPAGISALLGATVFGSGTRYTTTFIATALYFFIRRTDHDLPAHVHYRGILPRTSVLLTGLRRPFKWAIPQGWGRAYPHPPKAERTDIMPIKYTVVTFWQEQRGNQPQGPPGLSVYSSTAPDPSDAVNQSKNMLRERLRRVGKEISIGKSLVFVGAPALLENIE